MCISYIYMMFKFLTSSTKITSNYLHCSKIRTILQHMSAAAASIRLLGLPCYSCLAFEMEDSLVRSFLLLYRGHQGSLYHRNTAQQGVLSYDRGWENDAKHFLSSDVFLFKVVWMERREMR